jgi:hypothetical protein
MYSIHPTLHQLAHATRPPRPPRRAHRARRGVRARIDAALIGAGGLTLRAGRRLVEAGSAAERSRQRRRPVNPCINGS